MNNSWGPEEIGSTQVTQIEIKKAWTYCPQVQAQSLAITASAISFKSGKKRNQRKPKTARTAFLSSALYSYSRDSYYFSTEECSVYYTAHSSRLSRSQTPFVVTWYLECRAEYVPFGTWAYVSLICNREKVLVAVVFGADIAQMVGWACIICNAMRGHFGGNARAAICIRASLIVAETVSQSFSKVCHLAPAWQVLRHFKEYYWFDRLSPRPRHVFRRGIKPDTVSHTQVFSTSQRYVSCTNTDLPCISRFWEQPAESSFPVPRIWPRNLDSKKPRQL
jgi:hypothetical protein